MILANKTIQLIALICAALLSLSACSSPNSDTLKPEAQSVTGLSITPYNNEPLTLDAHILFGATTNLLSGWNHVESYPDEFTGLALSSEKYRIEKQPALTENKEFFSTTLVKKFADWNHQHANGITADFSELAFSEIAGIALVLKVNSTISNVPGFETIANTYSNLVSGNQLSILDDGNLHLSVALRAGEMDSAEVPRFNAEYLLSLDAKTQMDQWYRIFIPASYLVRYNEIHYKHTPVSMEKAKSIVISNFKLVAETRSTKVLRNLIPNTFNEDVPKLFKEIGLNIKYISVVKK